MNIKEKIELAKLLTLKELKLSKGKSDEYIANKAQDPFHRCLSKIRLFSGGNRTGKSVAGCKEADWHFRGIHPYRDVRVPSVGRIIARAGFTSGIDQVIVPKLLDWIPKDFIIERKKNQQGILCKLVGANGNIIYLMSGEQEQMSFEGTASDWIWFDEPPHYRTYIAALRGLIDSGGSMWITCTPISEPWMYDEIYLKSGKDIYVDGIKLDGIRIDTFFGSIFDNSKESGGYLSQNEILFFKDNTPDDEMDTRLYGQFKSLSGRVYKSFDPDIHVVDSFNWPSEWPVFISIDPHVNKEQAVLFVGVTDDDRLVCLDEVWAKLDLPELADLIIKRVRDRKFNVINVFIDPSINVNDGIYRINQKRVLEDVLRPQGLGLRYPHKKGNLKPGIDEINRLLKPKLLKVGDRRVPDLFVTRNCERIQHEFMRYQWHKNGEEPKKEFDDMLDNLRYIVSARPRFNYNLGITGYNSNSYMEDRYGGRDQKGRFNR